MLGDSQAVVDRGRRARGIQAGGGSHVVGRDPGDLLRRFGRVLRSGDELQVGLDVLAASVEERAIHQPFRDDDVGQRVDERDVRAWSDGQVVCRLDMRRADEVDPAGVGDDKPRPGAHSSFESGAEDWVGVGGVGADDEKDVGVVGRLEVLGAC